MEKRWYGICTTDGYPTATGELTTNRDEAIKWAKKMAQVTQQGTYRYVEYFIVAEGQTVEFPLHGSETEFFCCTKYQGKFSCNCGGTITAKQLESGKWMYFLN